MSENDIIISVGSQKLVELIGNVVKKTLRQHDELRLSAISPDHLFTRREVAEMLGVEYSSVRRMIERGTLKTTVDCRYIPKRSIDQYLNKKNYLGSAGEQPGSVPEAKVSLQTESCRPGGADSELGISSALLSGKSLELGTSRATHSLPDLPLQKTRARATEKNSKSNKNNNLNKTK